MKKLTETSVGIILIVIIPSAIAYYQLFSELKSKIIIPEIIVIDPNALLASVVIGGVLLYFYLQLNKIKRIQQQNYRRTSILIAAIHMLDNNRFWQVKRGELVELLTDEKEKMRKEEGQLRADIVKDLKDITPDEINFVMDALYRGRDKHERQK